MCGVKNRIFAYLFFVGVFLCAQSKVYGYSTKDGAITILGCGGAGMLLGMSTLSFSDRPQNNFKNIGLATALGLIGGVGLSVYLAATDEGVYDRIDPLEDDGDETDPADGGEGAFHFAKPKNPVVMLEVFRWQFF